jgi:thioredoxin reductase (NADPH)
MTQAYDVVVIGGGPAGYTAALYAARSGFSTVVVEKLSPGGQMATTSVDNYPGFPETIDGFELGEKMQQGAERFGAKTIFATVNGIDLKAEPKTLETSSGTIQAKVVIIATGANPRHLGLPKEENMSGKGVAYCATCDGRMFKDKVVAVNGGGNSAVEDAIYLAKICKKVYLVHRRDKLRATPVYWDSLKKNGVEIVWNSTVKGILGDSKVTGVELENVKTGATSELPVDGLFVAIGRKPESSLFVGQLDMDKAGYIIAGEDTKTSQPGVFAAGDVRTKAFRQIITAASDGANAVHSAEEILMK